MPKAAVEILRSAQDPRGCVFEPIGADELPHQKNVHVAVTAPGAIRGNHFHERSTEIAVVRGPALVRFREEGQIRDCHVPAGAVHRFTIPSMVTHAFQNTGVEAMVLVAFSTSEFNPATPDVVRDQVL